MARVRYMKIHLGLRRLQKLGEDLYCKTWQKFWYSEFYHWKKMKKIYEHKLKKTILLTQWAYSELEL